MPKQRRPNVNTENPLNVYIDIKKKKESIKDTLNKIITKEAKIKFLKLNINTYYCMNNKFISKHTVDQNTLIAKYCEKLLKEIK